MKNQSKQKKRVGIIIILVIVILTIQVILFVTGFYSFKTNNTHNINNRYTENNDLNDTNAENDLTNKDCRRNYRYVYNDKYIYKAIVTNENGALVYDISYKEENKNIVDTIEKGKEIGIVGDVIDGIKFHKEKTNNHYDRNRIYDNFEDIKDYYYLAIDSYCEPRYIKYTDVSIIASSIVLSNKFEKTQKVYVHEDTYLFDGPGLSFELNDNNKKILKGTILNVDIYNRIGNGFWLLVNSGEYNGWILIEYFNSVNYPYNNIKYGSATILNEEAGEITLENETDLYKYAFSTSSDEIILKIPSDTKIEYDYTTEEPGCTYYHVIYKGNDGWLKIWAS